MANLSGKVVSSLNEKSRQFLLVLEQLEDHPLSIEEKSKIKRIIDEVDIHKEIALDAINGV